MALMHTVNPDFGPEASGDGIHFNREPCIFPVLNKWVKLIPDFDDEATHAR